MDYRYSVEQCQVRSLESLRAFRSKQSEWVDWLNGDPEHSIFQQITSMMWLDAVYRLTNECRRLSGSEQPTSARAPILAEFMDQGYVAVVGLAVGKLVERHSKDPRFGVLSLRRLLDDMKAHRGIITREMFVCHDGLPYVSKPPQVEVGLHWVPTQGPESSGTAELAHDEFDRFAETEPEDRSPDDIVTEQFFDRLLAKLEAASIRTLLSVRNKMIAHAADATSRSYAGLASFGISLDEIADAQCNLIEVEGALRLLAAWSNGGDPVSTPQFDHLELLDRPFVEADNLPELQDWWNAHCQERRAWRQ